MSDDDDILEHMPEYIRPLASMDLVALILRRALNELPPDAPDSIRRNIQLRIDDVDQIVRTIEHGFVRCPKCGRVSYDTDDVRNKYCSHCHQSHDFIREELLHE